MVAQSPRELLREYERGWRDELARVSLVAELELAKQDFSTALFCLGRVWQDEYFPDRARATIAASYPASFVVAVAGAASMLTERNRVWPPIMDAAQLPMDGNLSAAWGRTFLECLQVLGLPTFPALEEEGAQTYVARMLLHGGVPLDHLDELFEVAEMARRQLGDVSRQVMQAWLVERADDGRLYHATKAVERFFRYGEDFAADFLDRAIELLDRVRDGAGLGDLQVGLPRRYLERAIELRESGLLPGSPARRSSAVAAVVHPEIRFDPYILGVHLVLPPVADATGSVTWIVDLGGEIERFTARAGRPGLPTPEIEVPLPPLVSDVDVARAGDEATAVRVMDLDDPHLVFDGQGSRVSSTSRLGGDAAWSVHPEVRQLRQPSHQELRLVESHSSVPRWPGWVAELVSLEGLRHLSLEGGRRYLVSGDASAELAELEVVAGVRSQEGHDVLRSWPALALPGAARGSTWEVSITDLSSDASVRRTLEVGSDGAVVALAEVGGVTLEWRPIRVRARGPLGRSLRKDLFVAPGLNVVVTPTLRVLEPGGLSAARVEMSWDDGRLEPFVLGADEQAREVSVGDATLVVEPPSVAVQFLSGSTTAWRSRPLALEARAVRERAGDLVVRLPGSSWARLEVLDRGGGRLQEVPPDGRARKDGAVRFDLARITDTLGAHGDVVLAVESDVWSGRVATIRPARLADVVTVSSDQRAIEFEGVPAEGVKGGIYRHLAPTLPPRIVDVAKGDSRISLSEELVGAGPLRILLRIEDPWVPEPWPVFPKVGTGTDRNIVDLTELRPDVPVLQAMHPLAPYLAGAEEFDGLRGRIGDALKLFDVAEELHLDMPLGTVQSQLAGALVSDPAASLTAAIDAELDGQQLARLLTATGIVASAVEEPLDLDRIETLWRRWPAAGLLAAGAVASDSPVSMFLESRCGPAALQLMAGEGEDIVTLPRIDEPMLLDLDASTLAMLRAEAGIAPKFLLDPDSRADDGFALVRVLQDPEAHARLADAIRWSNSLTRSVLEYVLPDRGLEVLERGILRRIQGTGWQMLPAASLAAATSARLSARAEHIDPYNTWASLTLEALVETVPRLAAADLVMAELAIQGAAPR